MKKGIPTSYKGVRFRSRLGATWACAFDLLGISWHYEPFDAAGYLPDFLLADRLLCEVKPFTWHVRDDSGIVEARAALEGVLGSYDLALLGLDFDACEQKQSGGWQRLLFSWELGAGDLFARFGVLGAKPLRYVGTQDWKRIWGTAQSRVQWKSKNSRRVIDRSENQ